MRLESPDAAVEPFPAKERADLMNVRNLSASKRISQPSEVLVNVPVIERVIVPFLLYDLAPVRNFLNLVDYKDCAFPVVAPFKASHSFPAV